MVRAALESRQSRGIGAKSRKKNRSTATIGVRAELAEASDNKGPAIAAGYGRMSDMAMRPTTMPSSMIGTSSPPERVTLIGFDEEVIR